MFFSNNPVSYLVRKTWHYSAGNRPMVILYFCLFVLANLFTLAEPIVIGKILNIVQFAGVTAQNLWVIWGYLSLIIVINIAVWACHGPARVLETKNAFLVRANYTQYLLSGTMALPMTWHTDHHSGDTIDKINKGTNALYSFTTDSFLLIETLVRLIGSYFVLVYFNFSSLYIVLGMVLITVWVILRFDKVLVTQYERLFKFDNTIAAKVFDALSNITTVIILRVEKLVLKALAGRIRQPLDLFIKNSRLNEMKWFWVTMCTVTMTFLVLASYLWQQVHLGTVVAIGTVYVIYGYVQRINDLFFRFADMYGNIVWRKTAVMNSEELVEDFQKKIKVVKIAQGKNWRSLTIKQLDFSYQTKEGNSHLDNVSFEFTKGERVALVGHSGSGKTTLLKLMRGLYIPQRLELYFDGQKMSGGFGDISSTIALIPQDPEIFATTIKENITVGADHSLAQIREYTDLAMFTEVVEKLPKKFNSSIVEKGVNLSGGEKQRLALARGLLACADKSIILLDEPTSSIDLKNEKLIYQNIFTRYSDRLIISSIHRLHLLPLFDRILLLENGRVVADGTFAELSNRPGPFKHLWDKYQK